MPICIVLVLVQNCIVYQKIMGIVLLNFTIIPYIVCISLFISELQEYASSHCSLLWYGKGIVYQQIIKTMVSNP